MHGKVIIMTGATSGIGAAVAEDLARRGAQLILLVRSTDDGWTQEYVTELRERTENQLVFAEECNLAELHSVRKFGTKWIDNTPPRRLDQVILCAGETQPMYGVRRTTSDGLESQVGINYLANFLLLNIISPALRAQPAERDVRVIVTTCTSYILASVNLDDINFETRGYPATRPWRAFGASKLYLMAMLRLLQLKIDNHKRPDGMPSRVKCIAVDPGLVRTQSFRRFVSFGTIIGLFVYLITYPIWFIFFKTGFNGAQSILYASMAPSADVDETGVRGGDVIQECRPKEIRRTEITDTEFQEKLWQASEKVIAAAEKRSALARKAAATAASAEKNSQSGDPGR